MLPEYFAIVGAVIASLGNGYYLYETLKGRAQPNRVTWSLWAIFPMITFVAQRVQGVEGLSWITLASGAMPIFIVAASFFNKEAYWKSSKLDYSLLVAALVGITLWAITDEPNIAIVFSIAADLLAGMPTIIKCYKHPATESWVAYSINVLGFGIGLLAVQRWTFENYSFVLYLTLINIVMAGLAAQVIWRRRQAA